MPVRICPAACGAPSAAAAPRSASFSTGPALYSHPMTLVEVTYELQSALEESHLRELGEFANTYGLRRFRVDAAQHRLSFEYDASRLKESQVANVLRQGRIPILRKVAP